FSSRRRHTRSKRDWSSDVCSSDLEGSLHLIRLADQRNSCGYCRHIENGGSFAPRPRFIPPHQREHDQSLRDEKRQERDSCAGGEIGRASCRERVEMREVAVGLKKK